MIFDTWANLFPSSSVADEDYKHAERIWKYFKAKNLGDYHGLYVQSNVSKPMNLILCIRMQTISMDGHKLPVNNLWLGKNMPKFDVGFIGCILEVDVECP